MIIFDFQKVLTTLKTEACSLYYKRKLSVYNFTIYDVIRHEATCYVWSENDTKKGSNEVASCLFHYIETKSSLGITSRIFHVVRQLFRAKQKRKCIFYVRVCLL